MSINDPNWGKDKKPNQGPPDLEDLWRDVNKRLSNLFGNKTGGGTGGPGKNNGSGNGTPRPPMNLKAFGGGIGALAILIFCLWLASGFYMVDTNERGVELTFGKFSQTTEPGLHLRAPAPFQTHELVRLTDVRVVEVGYRGSDKNRVLKEALMLTGDENIINIQFAVQWIVKDPQAFLFNNRKPEDTVLQAAETAMREVVGNNKMDDILSGKRAEVGVQASVIMQSILDRYNAGISVSQLNLQNVQAPEQVQGAFDDVQKAGQDRDRQVNEGEAYAKDVIPKAIGTASRLKEEADGYKARVVANAEGEASRFKQVLTEYSKAPEVTRSRMYIDTMQQVLSSTSKVMLDTKSQGNLLYLPLDKLMQAATIPNTSNNGAGDTVIEPRSTQPISNEVPPQLDKTDAAGPTNSSTSSQKRPSLSRERGER